MAKFVSGSSTSTGSFGTLGVGTTGGSNGYGLHIKSSGISTYPLFIEASDGSNLGGLYEGASGHGSFYVRNADGTAQIALSADGNDSYYGAAGITTVGDYISTGANKVISGSSTSTGSFGSIHVPDKLHLGSGFSSAIGTDKFTISASSGANIHLRTGGGDGSVIFSTAATTYWTIGRDNSDNSFGILNSGGSLGSNNAFTILNSSKYVGIGTNNPNRHVHIYRDDTQDANCQLKIAQDGTGDASLGFILTGVAGWAMGIDNSDSDKFKISTDADILHSGTRLTIDTSGNVGIGTTSPNRQLEIANAADAMMRISADTDNNTAAADAAIDFFNNGGELGFAGLREAYGSGGNAFVIATTASRTNRLLIQQDGKVGIGTSSPGTQLHVSSSASHVGRFASSHALGPVLGIYKGTSWHMLMGTVSGVTTGTGTDHDGIIMMENGYALHLAADSNYNPPALTVSGSGTDSFVGIGTKRPLHQLHVSGSTARAAINNNGYIERVYPLQGGSVTNVTIDPLQLDRNAFYDITYIATTYAPTTGQSDQGWRYLNWHAYDGSGDGGEGAGDNWYVELQSNSGTGESTDVPAWTVSGGNARLTYGNGYMSTRILVIKGMGSDPGFRDV